MTGRAENREYHYFYKITNLINGHYYYGVHNTDDLCDGYMGSGKRLLLAFKKYGSKNFKKEILKFFDTSKEAFEYESEIVTESLVKKDECYNCLVGGVFIDTTGFAVVKDKQGNRFSIDVNDENYKNGKYVGVNKGTVIVRDKNGDTYRVNINDEKYMNGEYVCISKGKVITKNNSGQFFLVDLNDERYKSGELKPVWLGRKHSNETILKMKETYKKTQHQKGAKNSQYGKKWINDGKTNKIIPFDEVNEYIDKGWVLGRIIDDDLKKKMRDSIKNHGGTNTVWISNDFLKKSTYIKKELYDEYLKNGWVKGRKY